MPRTRAGPQPDWLVASNLVAQATSAPIVAVVSNVDPERFVTLRWPGHTNAGLSVEPTDRLVAGAAWHTLSNYPPATTEQRFLGLATAAEGFYRLTASVSLPALTMAGCVDGWQYRAAADSKHRIDYTAASTGWTNWLTLTNLVLPTSPCH